MRAQPDPTVRALLSLTGSAARDGARSAYYLQQREDANLHEEPRATVRASSPLFKPEWQTFCEQR